MNELQPSERVNLISEIARRLGSKDWSQIDLTLRQFHFPCSNTWNSDDRSGYVIEHIEHGEDQSLIELGQHVGFDLGTESSQLEPTFWRPGHFRLFISHLATHKALASEIQCHLLGYGISSFVAHNDIEPTREWQDEIESALGTCDAMLALMHPGFHESKWTDQELGYAMGRDVLIVTAKFGEDPYGFLGRLQAMNGASLDSITLASKLFGILREHKRTSKRLSEALVGLFEGSTSFKDAKASMALLEGVTYWDRSLSHRVKNAVQSNSQISEAFGVPTRIENLISKNG